MRPVVISFPAPSVNSVCATQTTTSTSQGLILNGSLSNIALNNSQGYSPLVAFPGIQRTVSVTSTGSINTSTFTITGIDTRGVSLTTTLTGPTGITVNTTTEFSKVTAISVGTLASSTFTVGTGATGSSIWVQGDTFISPYAVTVAIETATTSPITIQDTPNDVQAAAPTLIFNHATLATVTVSAESNYAYPARFMRFICTATASATGSSQVTFIQAGY
jgi:hypothetical protein